MRCFYWARKRVYQAETGMCGFVNAGVRWLYKGVDGTSGALSIVRPHLVAGLVRPPKPVHFGRVLPPSGSPRNTPRNEGML